MSLYVGQNGHVGAGSAGQERHGRDDVSWHSGMDPEAIDRLAADLQRDGQRVAEVALRLNGVIAGSVDDWRGADADKFREDWHSLTAPGLLRAARLLEDFAFKARAQAQEQRGVSGGW